MTIKKVLQVTLASICVAATVAGVGLLKTTKVYAEPATAVEWATGNSAVTATFNYDLASSDYSAWAITAEQSTAMVANNTALAAKGFWTEESYTGLKPLVYSTTAVGSAANNSAISLGYYNDDDFKIACTLMQSYGINMYNGRADYLALNWKFTDIASGNYFTVCACGYNSDKTWLSIYYNEVVATSNRSSHKAFTDIGFSFTGKSGGVKFLNLWFDVSTKTLYGGTDLGQSKNVETFLKTEYSLADFPDFAEYTVELSFAGFNWNTTYQPGYWEGTTAKSGNLAVYYLNGIETHSTTIDNLLTPATAEWTTGNSAVNATFNYDLATSDYSGWAITAAQSTAMVANNTALSGKGFWAEESYTDLKPLVYSTTAVGADANNSKILLGYYDDDFKVACRPIQSCATGAYYGRADYLAVNWKFTDIATGNYFNVSTNGYNNDTGNLNIRYNATTTSSNTWLNRVSDNIGVSFTAKNIGIRFLNLWFNQSTKTLYFGNDLSQSVNVETYLTREKTADSIDKPATDFPDFAAYTVELSFTGFNWNTDYQPGDKTGNLAVYYLNGVKTHSTTKYTLDSDEAAIYVTQSNFTTEDGSVDTDGIVKAWDKVVGDVSSDVSYTVTAPDSSAVTVTDGKFAVTTSGEYTLTASVTANGVTTTKSVTLNVAFPTGGVILKRARLNLEGKIGVQFLVSADTALYDAEGGKVVFTVADETTEVAFEDWTAYETNYIVECKVAAKQMADDISVKFVDKNGAETATMTYSVKENANQVLTQYAENEELVSLVKATLNYGAYAQIYFNYNVENLANEGLFEDETNPVDELTEVTAATVSVSDALTEVSLKSVSLGLETETEIYVLFKLASGVSIEDVTIMLGDTTLETVETRGRYYVVIENISAKNIDEVYALTVTYGENTATYSISAQCYISAAFTDAQNEYNDLLKAIQLYNVAANAYFE